MGCWRLKIYIVRHGETNGNLRGALQGWMDELLNEKGRELAIITARALSDIKFDVAISSPLSRAYETAEIILRKNKKDIPPIQTDDRLKEWDLPRRTLKYHQSISMTSMTIHSLFKTVQAGSQFSRYVPEPESSIKN